MWQMVLDQRGNGYAAGFDPGREYEFQRVGGNAIKRYRMADQHPYFNIAMLMFREPTPTAS